MQTRTLSRAWPSGPNLWGHQRLRKQCFTSVKRIIFVFYKKKFSLPFKCVTLPTPSENFWGIFKKKIRVKHKRRNIVAVIQFFLVGMLFHCRSWAKIFGIVSLCYVKLVLFSFLPLMNQVTFSLGTTENRWNLSFISYVGIIFYHKSHRYSLYVRPKALHSVRDQLSGSRWR